MNKDLINKILDVLLIIIVTLIVRGCIAYMIR